MDETIRHLHHVLEETLGDRELTILEAGCGVERYVRFPNHKTYTIGIDIDAEILKENTIVDEKILGDIQDYPFPENAYDVIICWWVLEHLAFPEKALNNFQRAIKKDGLIVLAVPNLYSLKGLITRFTPHFIHRWYYRVVRQIRNMTPFPTYLKRAVSPPALERFARRNGLIIIYSQQYEHSTMQELRQQHKVMNAIIWLVQQIVRLVTMGKVDTTLTEYVIVMQKPETMMTRETHIAERPQASHESPPR